MKIRGSTPILANMVGVHLRNIHRKFEANLCIDLTEVQKKPKKVHHNGDGHRVIASHTHSLGVTNKFH